MVSRPVDVSPRIRQLRCSISTPLDLRADGVYAPVNLREDRAKDRLVTGHARPADPQDPCAWPESRLGISNRIRQISRDGLQASQGSLYPALHRLELRGDLESEMVASEHNRRARVYTLTRAGRRRLEAEHATWQRFVSSMTRVLKAD